MSDFDRAVDFVLELEGRDRLVNDSGGLTKWGISSNAHPDVDILSLTREQAVEIYRTEYWDECGCDAYAWPTNLVIFDAAVNQGTAYAKTLGFTALDYIEALLLRVERYNDLVERNHSLSPYLHGWVNRVIRIFKIVQTS